MPALLRHVAVLGGTFDPIHIGHLRAAVELSEQLRLDEVRLLPCHCPPHRDVPGASSDHRLAMVRAAITDEPNLVVDDRELQRAGPSYTVDSLAELRAELGADCALSLVMGADAFAGLDRWHRWQTLTELAHLIVVDRPGFALPAMGPVHDLWRRRKSAAEHLAERPAGGVALVTLPPVPISATAVRALIAADRSARWLVPDAVWRYIQRYRLYHDHLEQPPTGPK